MTDEKSKVEYLRALEDFRRARAKARLQHLWSAITGKSKELLKYDEISRDLRSSGTSSKGIQAIPVEAIVGSVNRYQDFDKNFLPLHDSDMERWANVKATMTSPGSPGLPPIIVYKLGDVYFVLDGNHRVSIAREMGIKNLEAYVTEIQINVPLSPDDSPDDIILKSEYSEFLEQTKFDKVVPGESLEITFPGQYETLKEHIRVHRHYMGIEQYREIPQEEAVRHWYDTVYKPVVDIIRDINVMQEFPQRTETDLYIWVLDHQSYLQEKLGWSIRPEKAAVDLASKHGRRFLSVLRRFWQKLVKFLLPRQLEDFSKPGEWHKHKKTFEDRLFADILVAFDASDDSWIAIEQAIYLAELEKADLRGLVVKYKTLSFDVNEDSISKAFSERIDQSGIDGRVTFVKGNISEEIIERSQYNDLLVLKLNYPPSPGIFARISSGIRTILRNGSRPTLFLRNKTSILNHILLAYDGSPKGKEALFVAAYLATRYDRKLSVCVVQKDEKNGQELLSEAQNYLGEHCSKAFFYRLRGRPSKIILRVAENINADMIIMGGYGRSPIFEILLGSTVYGVLRGTSIPVMVCQ